MNHNLHVEPHYHYNMMEFFLLLCVLENSVLIWVSLLKKIFSTIAFINSCVYKIFFHFLFNIE